MPFAWAFNAPHSFFLLEWMDVKREFYFYSAPRTLILLPRFLPFLARVVAMGKLEAANGFKIISFFFFLVHLPVKCFLSITCRMKVHRTRKIFNFISML